MRISIVFSFIIIIFYAGCQEYEIGRNKPVTQSCNNTNGAMDARCKPEMAVDGNTNTFTFAFVVKENVDKPWIQIDLRDYYIISRIHFLLKQENTNIRVNIFLRYDNNTNSLIDKYWFITDYIYNYNQPINATNLFNVLDEARYVTIKAFDFNLYLAVAEIEIYTRQGVNLARFKKATQFSTLHYPNENTWIASNAVDDDITTCTFQNNAPSWWQVDLGDQFNVIGIQIDNYMGSTSITITNFPNLTIYVDETSDVEPKSQCYLYTLQFQIRSKFKIYCNDTMKGRYVTIKSNGIIVKCDLIVFSYITGITLPTPSIITLKYLTQSSKYSNPFISTIASTNNISSSLPDQMIGLNTFIGVVVGVAVFLILIIVVLTIINIKLHQKLKQYTHKIDTYQSTRKTIVESSQDAKEIKDDHTYAELQKTEEHAYQHLNIDSISHKAI